MALATDRIDSPTRTLAIACCEECPFRVEIPQECCGVGQFFVPLWFPRDLANGNVYPGPPPDWCPLRGRAVVLEVRE